ncbi:ATP-binding protein [Spirosoma sordidisoli]|uniref:ATP-binding protein n=1 Tax=Spirosoma sordidisoli TaxID=2502893 RepID=A0A4Q2UMV3_9BACT|nr:ATP-binding protein [Spirosoma sordidisoli]RYC70734.1 ATP-binding protein [Spirosoma sordidisoli]
MNTRPIVLGLHGDPSIGKSTTALTAGNVLPLDFDMGLDRAGIAADAYPIHSWPDAVAMLDSEAFEFCDAVVIDTAKTCLDNFLAEYVMKQDHKNKRGNVLSLQGYGALGNEFKTWLNRIRRAGKDVIWVAHTKDEKDGDDVVKTPNITGGSYDLLMQCTDQLGYMTTQSGKRMIKFQISEKYRSKDSAYIGEVTIPPIKHDSHGFFLYGVIEQVRSSLADRTKKAKSKGEVWGEIKKAVLSSTDADSLNKFIATLSGDTYTAPDKAYAKPLIVSRARELDLRFNRDLAVYESATAPVPAPVSDVPADEPVSQPA